MKKREDYHNIINYNKYSNSRYLEEALLKGLLKKEKDQEPDDWKLPRSPEIKDTEDTSKPKSIDEVLAPLDEVFIPDELKDDIVTRVSIPELLDGAQPSYSGVIIFGPPGTGKTVLLRAISEVYRRAGGYSEDVSFSGLNSAFVGQFARNLEECLSRAINEAKKRKKPSFLSFDEGSILVEKSSEGAWSVAKHYQEAIDILKRYIGNHREVVAAVSTNVLPETFEEALTREGRLTTFFIGYPDVKQRAGMWKHFSRKYNILNIVEEQTAHLAALTGEEHGAFIEEFCRGYRRTRRAALLQEKGFSTLVDALKKGVAIGEDTVTESINYENFLSDVKAALDEKHKRNGKVEEEKDRVGFTGKK